MAAFSCAEVVSQAQSEGGLQETSMGLDWMTSKDNRQNPERQAEPAEV